MGLRVVLARDLRGHFRSGGGAATGLVFFLGVVATVPFAVGPDLVLLARIGPAILWIGALLSTLLTLDRLFQTEGEDGSLDLLLLGPAHPAIVVAAKCAALWIAAILPLVLASPILGLLLALEPPALLAVFATLLFGTPALVLIGAVGAALAVSLPRGGLLVSVLVLPLAIPVLVFGVLATNGALADPPAFRAPFLVLLALTLLAAIGGPIAAASALKAAAE